MKSRFAVSMVRNISQELLFVWGVHIMQREACLWPVIWPKSVGQLGERCI